MVIFFNQIPFINDDYNPFFIPVDQVKDTDILTLYTTCGIKE